MPGGMITPLENVNGCNTSRVVTTGEKYGANIRGSKLGHWAGIQRTGFSAVDPHNFSHKAVYLVHLVHPGFRPAFFCRHSLNLLAKGFKIFRMREETIQYSRERLLCSGQG